MHTFAPFILAAVTITLVISRPFHTTEVVWSSIGAVIALLTGLVTMADARVVLGMVWNATLALISIMILSAVLDRAGFFRWAALTIAQRTGGNLTRLMLFVMLLTAGVTVLFNNDGSVLILTPIVCALADQTKLDRNRALPLFFAVGLMADTASLPLVVSNLVNILAADFLGIGFSEYLRTMLVPGAVAIVATIAVTALYYRRETAVKYDTSLLCNPWTVVVDRGLFNAGVVILCGVVVGYFVAERAGIPVSIVAFAGALLALLISAKRKTVDVGEVLRKAPWSIVAFATGMFLVIMSLKDSALVAWLGALAVRAQDPAQYLALGGAYAGVAATTNNLPAMIIGLLSLKAPGISPAARTNALFALVAASDIGPKLTPIGSLATLLWMHILRQHGYTVSWGEYLKVGLILTPPILIAALLALMKVTGV